MASGIEMWLKSAGIDIEKIQADFSALKDGVVNTLKEIDVRLTRIEQSQQRMEDLWQTTIQQSQPQPPKLPQPQPAEPPQPQQIPVVHPQPPQ